MTLTHPEQARLLVLNRILDGQITAADAAELLCLSVRQVRRILAAYREGGAAALVHGNRGRAPAHTLDTALRQRIMTLVETRYAGVNDQHLTELLAEREDILLARSSPRRILRSNGLRSPRTRRPPKHRQRRVESRIARRVTSAVFSESTCQRTHLVKCPVTGRIGEAG